MGCVGCKEGSGRLCGDGGAVSNDKRTDIATN